MATRSRISADCTKRLLAMWWGLLLCPLAQSADVGVPTKQAQSAPHKMERPTAAYQAARTKPGDRVSINPQPLPPYPSATMTAQGAPAARPAPPRENPSPQSTSHGPCRPPSSQSGKKDGGAPSPINAPCTRIQSVSDSQAHKSKNQASVGNTPNWSALSGQTDSNSDLSMIQLQQAMSGRQKAVAEVNAVQNGSKPNCPKCPSN